MRQVRNGGRERVAEASVKALTRRRPAWGPRRPAEGKMKKRGVRHVERRFFAEARPRCSPAAPPPATRGPVDRWCPNVALRGWN